MASILMALMLYQEGVGLNCASYRSDITGETVHEVDICEVIISQQNAWNSGDIPGFMAGYWNSPELRFASGGSITRGWQPTLERYKARYDTPETMGRLTFSDLTIDVFSDSAAIVFGRWALERDDDEPTGLFTLTFRQLDENWVIVADHTSSAD